MERNIHKIYDYILKIILLSYMDEFLIYIGEERKIVEKMATERQTLNGKTKYLDFLCKLEDDTICNIEFQFPTPYTEDLERFYDYNIVVRISEEKITETIIISFAEKNTGSKNIEIGNSISYHPKIIYLGDIDYKKRLTKIKQKLNYKYPHGKELENINNTNKTNTKLTFKEELDLLIMSLLPKYKNKKEMLKEIKNVLKKEKALRKEKLEIIKLIIDYEIENLIPKKDQEYLKEDDKMTPEVSELMIKVGKEVNKKYEQLAIDDARKEGIKEGMKEGKEKEKEEIAKKLKKIHTPEEIANITELSIETIEKL